MEKFTPWEYARATKVELTDAGGTLSGRYAPTVRNPIGRLPGGGLVLGVADVVVANDPITGQGSNSASKCAATYLASILEHGEKEFDEAWMRATFDRYWDTAQHVTKWTNAMLAPPPEHIVNLLGAAGQLPRSPTASPTPSTTRPTSRTSSTSRRRRRPTWRRFPGPPEATGTRPAAPGSPCSPPRRPCTSGTPP